MKKISALVINERLLRRLKRRASNHSRVALNDASARRCRSLPQKRRRQIFLGWRWLLRTHRERVAGSPTQCPRMWPNLATGRQVLSEAQFATQCAPRRLRGAAAPRCSPPGAKAAARRNAAKLEAKERHERECFVAPLRAELTPAWRARRSHAWTARRAHGGRGPSRGLWTHRGAASRRTTCGGRVARHDATTDRPMDAGQIPSDVRRVRGGLRACALELLRTCPQKKIPRFPLAAVAHLPGGRRPSTVVAVLQRWSLSFPGGRCPSGGGCAAGGRTGGHARGSVGGL